MEWIPVLTFILKEKYQRCKLFLLLSLKLSLKNYLPNPIDRFMFIVKQKQIDWQGTV